MNFNWKQLTCLSAFAVFAAAQTPVQSVGGATVTSTTAPAATTTPVVSAAPKGPERPAPDYVLGPEDQVIVRAFEAEEISDKPVPISSDGFLTLPMVGRVHAAGLTVPQLEAALTTKLAKYIQNPQVTVLISDYRSQPVSVLGAVNTAGVVQLRGQKRLMDVISLAGGLRTDAGYNVIVTRNGGKDLLPVANAKTDPSGKFSTANVNLRDIMNGKTPEANIVIQPNDVVTVPKAQLIYVLGEVGKPGGFMLDDHETLSSLQCVALAGGLARTAAPKKAKILRLEPGKPERTEIATNLSKIMNGDAPDVTLRADDILFIPNNLPKSAALRATESAIQIGTGIVIWRR